MIKSDIVVVKFERDGCRVESWKSLRKYLYTNKHSITQGFKKMLLFERKKKNFFREIFASLHHHLFLNHNRRAQEGWYNHRRETQRSDPSTFNNCLVPFDTIDPIYFCLITIGIHSLPIHPITARDQLASIAHTRFQNATKFFSLEISIEKSQPSLNPTPPLPLSPPCSQRLSVLWKRADTHDETSRRNKDPI